MRLDIEGSDTRFNPTERHVRTAISGLRSYGPKSFASLTDEAGNYLQVAGGTQSCLLERHVAAEGLHFRGYWDKKSAVFDDGTVLAFGGGEIAMKSDEWLPSNLVADAFTCFLMDLALPPEIRWRDVTQSVFGDVR